VKICEKTLPDPAKLEQGGVSRFFWELFPICLGLYPEQFVFIPVSKENPAKARRSANGSNPGYSLARTPDLGCDPRRT